MSGMLFILFIEFVGGFFAWIGLKGIVTTLVGRWTWLPVEGLVTGFKMSRAHRAPHRMLSGGAGPTPGKE